MACATSARFSRDPSWLLGLLLALFVVDALITRLGGKWPKRQSSLRPGADTMDKPAMLLTGDEKVGGGRDRARAGSSSPGGQKVIRTLREELDYGSFGALYHQPATSLRLGE